MTDFSNMTAAQLNDWYEANVGYRPQVDCPQLTTESLRDMCIGADLRHNADPHAICRKWVDRIGSAFSPYASAASYTCCLGLAERADYDRDMEVLFDVADNAQECADMAKADKGFC